MSILNIPLIKDRIRVTHEGFKKSVGNLPEKISADQLLMLKRMATRVETICRYFVEEHVVDEIVCERPNFENSCTSYKLIKKGYDKNVDIWIDTRNIVIKQAHYPTNSGLNMADDIIIRDIDFDSYNWIEFVDQLLHFVHKIIYAKSKSYESSIFNG
jgi:hypothetical protein